MGWMQKVREMNEWGIALGFCSSKWVSAEDAELGSGDGENTIWREETKCSILSILRCL